MLNKRSVIVALVGLNLFLFALLALSSYSPTMAFAQAGGRAGDFSCVTAKAAGQSYDVVYVLDRQGRKLHAFYPGAQGKFAYGKFRDLTADFRGQPKNP